MTSQPAQSRPQSGALILTVLSHVMVLPVASAFLPAYISHRGWSSETSVLVMVGIYAALVLVLHGLAWRSARRNGERRLAIGILALMVLSFASIALLATPSPLVAIIHVVGLLFF
jgi:chromate transport protein ChrA